MHIMANHPSLLKRLSDFSTTVSAACDSCHQERSWEIEIFPSEGYASLVVASCPLCGAEMSDAERSILEHRMWETYRQNVLDPEE